MKLNCCGCRLRSSWNGLLAFLVMSDVEAETTPPSTHCLVQREIARHSSNIDTHWGTGDLPCVWRWSRNYDEQHSASQTCPLMNTPLARAFANLEDFATSEIRDFLLHAAAMIR